MRSAVLVYPIKAASDVNMAANPPGNSMTSSHSKTEYAILKLLIRNPSQVITKSLLLDRISEDTPDCVESSLKVHVSNLRRKLKEVSGKDYIEAVWGIGFKLNEDLAAENES